MTEEDQKKVEQYKVYLENTYRSSSAGKLIVTPNRLYPKKKRTYSLDGREMTYVLLMDDVTQEQADWHCIAKDYNKKQIDELQHYLEWISKELEITQYKYRIECLCENENELQIKELHKVIE